MTQPAIHIAITNWQMLIVLPLRNGAAEAFLLSSAGEEKERFQLQSGRNHILLQHHLPGTYALRIETENDVTVKQIILPAST